MRKIICLSVALLILAGVGCATLSKTTLTKENQATLKGTWDGMADFRSGQMVGLTLVITNDAPPFKGNIKFSNIPASSPLFPGNFGGATTYAGPFDNGVISNKGTFVISGQAGNFGEFSLMGPTKLDGWLYLWGAHGSATLTKK